MLLSLIQEAKNLWETIQEIRRPKQTIHVDPSRFDDPLAQDLSWKPLKRGSSYHRRFVEVEPHRVEFRATGSEIRLWLVLLVPGAGFLLLALGSILSGSPKASSVLITPFALWLTALCVCKLRGATTPVVFDKLNRLYWRGRKSPEQRPDRDTGGDWTELAKIHALQIVSEVCRGDEDRRYLSHELNLVLANGERLNVTDHSNRKEVLEDAERLAAFLDVPLWNAASEKKFEESIL